MEDFKILKRTNTRVRIKLRFGENMIEKTYEFLELRQGKGNKKIFTCKLEVGADIECRDYILKELQENAYIQKTFKLNIKRLNRWWYRVYFDKLAD